MKNTYIKKFLEDMRVRKYSPNSVKSHKERLNNFISYLEKINLVNFQDVTAKILESYRLYIVEKKYTDNTIEAYLQSVKMLFFFLADKSIIFENPAFNLTIRRAVLKLGYVMNENEIRVLLGAPDISGKLGIRDRAMLEVLYSTGVRREELINMKVYDADISGMSITVLGKGSKQRMLPLGHHAAKYTKIYLKNVRPALVEGKALTDALWLNHVGSCLSDLSIGRMVKQYVRKIGLDDKITTHTIRRTCATHLLKNGAHPLMVAQLLGHSTLKTLSHYLKTTIADITKAHKATAPGR